MPKFIYYPGISQYYLPLDISQGGASWQRKWTASTGLLVVSQLSTNFQSIVNQWSTEPRYVGNTNVKMQVLSELTINDTFSLTVYKIYDSSRQDA